MSRSDKTEILLAEVVYRSIMSKRAGTDVPMAGANRPDEGGLTYALKAVGIACFRFARFVAVAAAEPPFVT